MDPAGAKLTIDGAPISLDPELWIALEPGMHEIVIAHEGYETKRQSVDVRAGSEEVLQITLARTSAEALNSSGPRGSEPPEPGRQEADELSATRLGLGIAGIALGVGGGVAAAVLGVTAADRADGAEELRLRAAESSGGTNACGTGSPILSQNTCPQLSDYANDQVTFTGAAIGAGVAGGALLIGGILALALPESPDSATVGLAVDPRMARIELGGSF